MAQAVESRPLRDDDLESKPLAETKAPAKTGTGIGPAALGQAQGELLKGAAKGAISTVSTIGKAARKYVPGVALLDRIVTPKEFHIAPSNALQSAGFTAEQIGEFFLPAGVAKDAEVAILGVLPRAYKTMRSLGTAAQDARWIVGFAKPATKMAVQGATNYGVAKAQGDPNAKTAGALGAGGAVVGGVVGPAAKKLETSARAQVGRAFGASTARLKAIANKIAPDVLKGTHGSVWGATMESVLARAESVTSEVGEKIEGQIKQYGKLNFSDTLQGIHAALEDAKGAYRVVVPAEDVLTTAGDFGFGENGEKIIAFDARKLSQLNRLQRTIADLRDYGQGTLDNLIGVRRAWDEVVAKTGGFAEKSAAGTRAAAASLKDNAEGWAKREGVRAIRQVLSSPEHVDLKKLQALNAQYSFWTNIQDLSEGALSKSQDQAGRMIKALGIATGAVLGEQVGQRQGGGKAGGIGGALIGAAAGGASVGGVLGKQLVAASRSPAFRLASAQVKHQIADAIMNGHVDRASRLLSRFAAAVASGPSPAKETK